MKERIPHLLNPLSNFLMPVDAFWLSLGACSVCVDTYVQTAHFKLFMRFSKEQLCTFLFKQNCKLCNLYEGKTWFFFLLHIFLPFLVQLSSSIRVTLP